MRDRLRRGGIPYLGIVSLITLGTALGYVGLLGQQGDWPALNARQTAVLALLGAFAITGLVGTFVQRVTVRAATSAACTTGLLLLGFLGLFSIGLPLLVAGAIALAAWAEARRGRETLIPSIAGGAVGVAVLVLGFAATG